jgi:hypothetical protein
MFLAPPLKLFGSEFRAIVRSDDLRLASPSDNALQGRYNAFGGQGSINFNSQCLPCTIIHDVESSEFAVPHDAITHKIHAPAMIDCFLPLGGRAQPFFENRSLKSWLSIARSAYILLSRECPSSRVLSFWTSDTSTPPVFGLPLVKGGGCDAHFTADDPGGYAGFMLLKGSNDLNLGES